jgi:L-lactate dehydrogenase complex protein LldE
MRIALFITCINDGLYPNTPRSVVEVLERLGHTVIFPTQQSCCGQMHLNTGYREEGLHLAQRFRQVFNDYDYIVTPSASCAGTVKEQYATSALSVGADTLATDLHDIGQRTFEFSEFLTRVLNVTDVGARFEHRVAYHPTCHSLRVLHLDDGPTTLLRHVAGLELVEFSNVDACCGFGGMFAIKNAETSSAMGFDKLAAIEASGAEVLCAVDNSCLTHIGGLASRQRSPLRRMHLAEILASQGE